MRVNEIPPGSLELLILTTLCRAQELHGFQIVDAIERTSGDVLIVPEGSLYPALQRLLVNGCVTARWGTTAGNRRACYYRLTARGRKQLEGQVSAFERIYAAIRRVVRTV